ncbi:MAG: sugar kinase [Proteobacteria bacterium]|nr:sugar kinase [Pseudomonadota bacterium]MBU4009265.1 sugar kinase [Pseudomonadota bacterium]MBU4035766.1 sugar kinase [Pseudomonadota bacterium]
MGRYSENKIVLIVRKTRLDELVARFNTESQARFYVEHLGADFSDYKREHEKYKASVQDAQRILSRMGRLQTVDREFITNFIFGHTDTVVVLGQDGLVANVLKYLNGQSVVGVNPDPDRWEGVLLPFSVPDLPKIISDVFSGSRLIREVTMAKAELNNGQTLYGVNDLFIGPKSHTSARYELQIGDHSETHSSSGIIVSTGLGSTGWFRSILAGATGIASRLSGKKLQGMLEGNFEWDSNYLYFSIREPWPSKTSSAETTFGKITPNKPLKLVSQMPENGVIFSDGIENDFLEFNSGRIALISVAEKTGHLVT